MAKAPEARLLLASAITKLHPGAGRSPGLVDLPVVRDPLGYPYLPGSELKGALKTLLARHQDSVLRGGKVDCNNSKGREICCLLGGEVGEGQKGASAVVIADAYPVLLPVPTPSTGVAYATTPYLLSRAAAYLRAAGLQDEAEALESLASQAGEDKAVTTIDSAGDFIYVGAERLPAKKLSNTRDQDVLDSLANGLNPLYAAIKPSSALVVVPEAYANHIISKALQRITRVRLNRETKTVERGALWTEEYLPWGTLLAGLLVDSGFKNEFCGKDTGNPVDALITLLAGDNSSTFYIVIGGKESVGAGVLKAKVHANSQPGGS